MVHKATNLQTLITGWSKLLIKNELILKKLKKKIFRGFPGGAVVKNLPANAGDMGSIPGPGRSHMPRSN